MNITQPPVATERLVLRMLQPDDLMIGVGGIMTKTIPDEPRLNLYFRFRPEAWGRAYATEMARVATGKPR
jgi:hypothetical protein